MGRVGMDTGAEPNRFAEGPLYTPLGVKGLGVVYPLIGEGERECDEGEGDAGGDMSDKSSPISSSGPAPAVPL